MYICFIGVVAELKTLKTCNDDKDYHLLIRCILFLWKIKNAQGVKN